MRSAPLKVLTFNLLQLPLITLLPAGRRRARYASELIKANDPDVVVLNEAFPLSSASHIFRVLTDSGYHRAGDRNSRSGNLSKPSLLRRAVGSGVQVFSRFSITEQAKLSYRASHPKTLDACSAMGVILTRISLPDTSFWLVATHLQADQPPVPVRETQAVRLAQLAELHQFITASVPADAAVLLAGDLNIEYFSDTVSRTPGNDHLAANQVIKGRIEPHNGISGFSFDAFRNPLAARSAPGYRNNLDYIGHLSEDGSRPTPQISAQLLSYLAGQDASDHFPVLAEVVFPR